MSETESEVLEKYKDVDRRSDWEAADELYAALDTALAQLADAQRRIEALEERLSLCPSLDVALLDYQQWREKARVLLARDAAEDQQQRRWDAMSGDAHEGDIP